MKLKILHIKVSLSGTLKLSAKNRCMMWHKLKGWLKVKVDKKNEITEDIKNEVNNSVILENTSKEDEIEYKNNYRLAALYLFGFAIAFLQFKFSRYADNNNDPFGIVIAFYTLINITLFPALITIGIVFITLFKRDYKRDFCIYESLIAWKVISFIIGVIPVFIFSKSLRLWQDRILLDALILGINVLVAITGNNNLCRYVQSKSELK